MRRQLRPLEPRWDLEEGHLVFEHHPPPTRLPFAYRAWQGTQVCFVGNRLSALSTHYRDADMPERLAGWLEVYGPPDLVTWGRYYTDRSLVWAEEGMLVVINIDFDQDEELVLFSPIPLEALGSSWLMEALPEEGQECPVSRDEVYDDGGCYPLEYEVPDFWGIQKTSVPDK